MINLRAGAKGNRGTYVGAQSVLIQMGFRSYDPFHLGITFENAKSFAETDNKNGLKFVRHDGDSYDLRISR